MIPSPYFGTSDIESSSNLGRSLTHEIGYFLGLEHLFGKIGKVDCVEYDDDC
ncbi:M43 family zinc metalloprotease [Flavivirga amylovorans]|uniref:M43 family zinc metalloprotease n=1 Tax=Flavivirga amylovorans TaxID=870486 RepID=A0ABT8WX59_9FLAO|nr:M43 family zinc metalloprotease [Flavivirga amylovorans]MDO5986282.1 M43 family zinc metalloprotease [Flavivirga amylovorans]